METIDEEVLDHTKNFIADAKKLDKPFFVWFNTTQMHVYTHLKKESQGVTGQGIEADGMVEHDKIVVAIDLPLESLKLLIREQPTLGFA